MSIYDAIVVHEGRFYPITANTLMAHKKAAGSAKNLRDSKPKYRGVKVYGGQPVKAGDIIIRQKGDTYKLGANVYKGKDFTIHAQTDGVVRFGKKNYTRYDGKIYLKTFVEVVDNIENASTKQAPKATKKAPAKKTAPKAASTTTEKKAPAAKQEASTDLASMTLKDLKAHAKSLGLKGYSTLKKDALIALIEKA